MMILDVGQSVDSVANRTQDALMDFRRDSQDGFKYEECYDNSSEDAGIVLVTV